MPDIRLQPIPALASYIRRFLLAGGVHIRGVRERVVEDEACAPAWQPMHTPQDPQGNRSFVGSIA